jgi:transcriptional regulator with XRE-family HTH domain
MVAVSFAEKFQRALASAGLTKYALAKASGVSESQLGKVERGDVVPTDENLVKLAPHLRVSAQQLIDWANEHRARRTIGDEAFERIIALHGGRVHQVEEAPAFNPFAALAGDEPPALDDQELAAVAELATLVGDLTAYSPAYRPNGQGWRQPAGARLAALMAMVEEAREDAARAKQASPTRGTA